MLSRITIAKIRQILDSSELLRSVDFNILNKGDDLKISYLGDDEVFFKATINTDVSEFTYSPGKFMHVDEDSFGEDDELFGLIEEWLSNIEETIKLDPLYRHFEERFAVFEKKLEETLNKSAIPDTQFSYEEISELRSSLEEMREKIAEIISKQTNVESELKEQIDRLNKDIDYLKTILSTSNQKSWWRITLRRLGVFFGDEKNRKLIKDAYSFGQFIHENAPSLDGIRGHLN